ncbi:MAG: hypothetical protein ACLPTL_16675 [Steroidobacteraceae bacterium]
MSAFAYTDLFYPDPRALVKVRAVLSVLDSEHGGHRITTQASWRPNHNFGDPDGRSFYIGQVDFGLSDINPGDTREVLVQFFDGPGLRDLLQPGRTWRIQEGPRLFARAKVVELVGET